MGLIISLFQSLFRHFTFPNNNAVLLDNRGYHTNQSYNGENDDDDEITSSRKRKKDETQDDNDELSSSDVTDDNLNNDDLVDDNSSQASSIHSESLPDICTEDEVPVLHLDPPNKKLKSEDVEQPTSSSHPCVFDASIGVADALSTPADLPGSFDPENLFKESQSDDKIVRNTNQNNNREPPNPSTVETDDGEVAEETISTIKQVHEDDLSCEEREFEDEEQDVGNDVAATVEENQSKVIVEIMLEEKSVDELEEEMDKEEDTPDGDNEDNVEASDTEEAKQEEHSVVIQNTDSTELENDHQTEEVIVNESYQNNQEEVRPTEECNIINRREDQVTHYEIHATTEESSSEITQSERLDLCMPEVVAVDNSSQKLNILDCYSDLHSSSNIGEDAKTDETSEHISANEIKQPLILQDFDDISVEEMKISSKETSPAQVASSITSTTSRSLEKKHSFLWKGRASSVYVTGTWLQWGQRIPLRASNESMDVWETVVEFPAEVTETELKFIVDGEWLVSPDMGIRQNEFGAQNNILVL